jgi:hypothetical protein
MWTGHLWLALCAAALGPWISGCSRATHWQQIYEGCKSLAAALAQEPGGLLKTPDCERIQQLCSRDPHGSDCKSELAKYSTQ